MNYFEKYTSNSVAGYGNQFFFNPDKENGIYTGRSFFRLTVGGRYEYSLLFSNTVDSTYHDGTKSNCNLVCGEWEIHSLRVAVCKSCDPDVISEESFIPVTFVGQKAKTVAPGEFFSTDPFTLDAKAHDFLCIEIKYSGKQIPYHHEAQIAMYDFADGKWELTTKCPAPSMIGCARNVKAKVCFMGDSITQGIGSTFNSYNHYAAKTAEKLPDSCSYWDIGIGFARASDAASNGAWMFKAKQADLVILCLGVNDILWDYKADTVSAHLHRAVRLLKDAGKKIIIQTPPPFDFSESYEKERLSISKYIKESIAPDVEAVFEPDKILSDPEDPPRTLYGGHPNDEGCAKWAEALAPVIKGVIETM